MFVDRGRCTGVVPKGCFLGCISPLGYYGFHLCFVSFGLVDEGLVRALPFGAFPWPFFYFWVCEIGHSLGFADFGSSFWGVVSVCGGMVLDLVPSLWGGR